MYYYTYVCIIILHFHPVFISSPPLFYFRPYVNLTYSLTECTFYVSGGNFRNSKVSRSPFSCPNTPISIW